MAEYIERQELLKVIENGLNSPCREEVFDYDAVLILEEKVQCMPAADVAPVRHGRWEGYSHSRYCGVDGFGDPIYKDGVVYYCSECRRKTVIKERYCPACGAKMDENQ